MECCSASEALCSLTFLPFFGSGGVPIIFLHHGGCHLLITHFMLQAFELDRIASNYETSADRDRTAEVRTRNRYFENLKTAQVDQLIENALGQSNADPLVTVGEKVLMSSCRKRPHDLTKQDSLFTGPYVVTGVKPNKVKIMSIKDNTNVKVVTELERLLPYKETYKLSFFESNPKNEGCTTPTTTLQIITCDNDFNDEDELSEESFQQGVDVPSE